MNHFVRTVTCLSALLFCVALSAQSAQSVRINAITPKIQAQTLTLNGSGFNQPYYRSIAPGLDAAIGNNVAGYWGHWQAYGFIEGPASPLYRIPYSGAINEGAAYSQSGLPVTFSVTSGPASISGSTLTLTGVGTVVLRATQAGGTTPINGASFSSAYAQTSITVTGQPQAVRINPISAKLVGQTLTLLGSGFNQAYYRISEPDLDAAFGEGLVHYWNHWQAWGFLEGANDPTYRTPFSGSGNEGAAYAQSGLPVTFSVDSGPASISGATLTFTGSGVVTLRASQAGGTTAINGAAFAASSATTTIFVNVPNSPPRITAMSATPATLFFGESTTVSSTAYDSDGNLAFHGMLVWNPIGNYYRGAMCDHTTGWGNGHPTTPDILSASYSSGVCSGTTSIRSIVHQPSWVGTITYHSNTADASGVWASTDPANWALCVGSTTAVVSAATPSGSFSDATKTATSITYSVASGDLNATFANPFSGAVAAPVGSIAYTIAPGSPNGTAGAAVTVGSTLTSGSSYKIRATFTPSNSNYTGAWVDSNWTVTKANQTITFAAPAAQTYGTPLTLSATASSGLAVSYAASGPATVSGNVVTFTGAGSVTVTASQAGNTNYNAASNVARTFTVNRANQTITFAAPAAQTYGTPLTLAATASSGLAVSYVASGPATVSGSVVTFTGAGSVTVTASQAGNTNYNAASNVARTFTVNRANQTITFAAPAAQTYGTPLTLSATASSGLVVSYTASGPATVSGNVVTFTGAGSVTVTASQAGNTNYNAASNVSRTFTVNKANQTITFAAPATQTYGTPLTLSATASSGLAVSYVASGPATVVGSVVTFTGTGSVTVTASQVGNTNYNAASNVARTFTVNRADQTITFANPGPQHALISLPLTASAPAGSVGFTVISGPATVSGAVLTLTGYGTVTVRASQAGNTNFNAALNVDVSFLVSSNPPSSRVRTAATNLIFGQPFEFFTDATDVDANLVKVEGYVRGPGSYTPASPWGTWSQILTNSFAATGSKSGTVTYYPQAAGTYNYCGVATDATGANSVNPALTAWADWNVWNVAGMNNSVGTFAVAPATPVGTFPAKTFSGAHMVSSADWDATFANPYSTAVPAPTGLIGLTVMSASGPNASPTGEIYVNNTTLQPGIYVVRATYYPAQGSSYNGAFVDTTFTVSPVVIDPGPDSPLYINGAVPAPINIAVMGRGAGTVTVTIDGTAHKFKFIASAGNAWSTPVFDPDASFSISTYIRQMCNYGTDYTCQVSSTGVTDYYIKTTVAPEVSPKRQPQVEIDGKLSEGVTKTEIQNNAFVLRTKPISRLPFGSIDTSNFATGGGMEFGLGNGRSGNTAGRIFCGPESITVYKGDAMEGSFQSTKRFQAKVPLGYVDVIQDHRRTSVLYYADSTPFTPGTFREFSVPPVASYTFDQIPTGPTSAVPAPTRYLSSTWNMEGTGGRAVITRTINGGEPEIYEIEGFALVAQLEQNSSPYPGGGFVVTTAKAITFVTRMWPWHAINAPRTGLIRTDMNTIEQVTTYPNQAPSTTRNTLELDMTSYLGATEASPVADYNYRNTDYQDPAFLKAEPLVRGLGVDQHETPHSSGGALGYPNEWNTRTFRNGLGGGTITEYYSLASTYNGGSNLGDQPTIAMGEPKYLRRSFGDAPLLGAGELISTYSYGQELVDGLALPSTMVTKQGDTTVGLTGYVYSSGFWDSHLDLPTLTTATSQYFNSTSLPLTTTTTAYSRRVADADLRSRPLSVSRPDGTKTSYAYQRGTLAGSTWNGAPNGAHFLTAEVSGKTGNGLSNYRSIVIDGLDLEPNVATAAEKIFDAGGRLLCESSYVYQGGTSFSLLNSVYFGYDRLGNLLMKADQPVTVAGNDIPSTNGRVLYQAAYSGFRKMSESDEQGITRTYQYNAYGGIEWMKRASASYAGNAVAETKTSYLYDAVGRIRQETVSGAGESDLLVTTYTYDTASRPKTTTQPGGLLSSISYDSPTKRTTILPGGGTKVEILYADGRKNSTTGTAVTDSAASYSYDPTTGNLKTVQNIAGQIGTQTDDWLGRTLTVDSATHAGGTRTTKNTYNTLGQLTKQETLAGNTSIALAHLYRYNSFGRLDREGLDADLDSLINPSTDFSVKEYEIAFQTGAPGYASNWYFHVGQKIWPYAAVANANTFRYVSESYTQMSGLTSAQAAHSIALDFDRNKTDSITAIDRANKTVTTTATTTGTNQTLTQISLNGLPISSTNAQGQTTLQTYDGLGRLETSNDPRIGMTSVMYQPNTAWIQYSIAPDYMMSGFTYDSAGRIESQTNNNNKTANFQYDEAGNLTYTWGDTVYPVRYEYNDLGQKTKMYTYGSGSNGKATIWDYQISTGLLNSKTDPAEKVTTYYYDAMNRVNQRKDARGWYTYYNYTPAGLPWTTSYSDGVTTTVTYDYDRAGRVKSVADAAGSRSFGYFDTWSDNTYDNELRNKSARVASETLPGYFGGHVINYDYQYAAPGGANGALTSLKIGAGSLYTVGYGFDAVGRLGSVSYSGATTFSYAYVANSNLVDTVAQGTTGYKRDYDYEPASNRVGTLKNQFGSVSASTVETRLTYDFLGLRNTEKTAGTAYLTALGRGSEAGVHADYMYTDRNELDYSAKYQLTSGWGLGLIKGSTELQYTYDPIGNRTRDIIAGVDYGLNALNQYTSAPAAGGMTYDGNGNLKTDATRSYDYDGENRLIKVTVTQSGAVWNYAYDYMGRRIRKWGTGLNEQRFIYDGWNLIAETDAAGTITRRYAWGLDVSGSLQGAGGVGGLLLIQNGTDRYYPLYDASHNVIGLYNSTGGIDSAYEYDPFGKLQTQLGAYAAANPFRFSTKYTDDETSFTYYGHRYYSSLLGRFINRDPIEESGGINLYAFCENDGVNGYDLLGLDGWDFGGSYKTEPMPKGDDGITRLPPVTVPGGPTREDIARAAAEEADRKKQISDSDERSKRQEWDRIFGDQTEKSGSNPYRTFMDIPVPKLPPTQMVSGKWIKRLSKTPAGKALLARLQSGEIQVYTSQNLFNRYPKANAFNTGKSVFLNLKTPGHNDLKSLGLNINGDKINFVLVTLRAEISDIDQKSATPGITANDMEAHSRFTADEWAKSAGLDPLYDRSLADHQQILGTYDSTDSTASSSSGYPSYNQTGSIFNDKVLFILW